MKALRLYRGHDSYGRQIEAAESIGGGWFWREWVYNGYGPAWSKWALLDRIPVHPERIRNRSEYFDAPEYIDIPVDERVHRIEWGFNTLLLTSTPYRVRLPD